MKPFNVAGIICLCWMSLFMLSCGSGDKTEKSTGNETVFIPDSTEVPGLLIDFNREYEGTIGENKVWINLRLNGTVLHGEYRYSGHQGVLKLHGELDTISNRFTLEESTEENQISGKWNGIIRNNLDLEGQWCVQGRKGGCLELKAKAGSKQFVWYKPDFPFHPWHLGKLSRMAEGKPKPVDLNQKPDLKGLKMYDAEMSKTSVGYWEVVQEDEILIRPAFFEYRYIGRHKKEYLFLCNEGGGGSGIFSYIMRASIEGNRLKFIGAIAGGDRCNNGLADARMEEGQIKYDEYITFSDLIYLSKRAQQGGEETELDLMSCSMCCVGDAQYVYDFAKKESKLESIKIDSEGFEPEHDDPNADMTRLLVLLNGHLKTHGASMSLDQLEELAKKLIEGSK